MKGYLWMVLLWCSTLSVWAQKTAVECNTKAIEYAKKGDFTLALSWLDKAIATDAGFADAYYNRGNVHRIQKQYDLAIRDYTKTYELKGNSKVLYARANTYMDAKEYLNAVGDYTTILTKEPRFQNIYFDRGYAYIALEKYAEAKVDLETQLKTTPQDFKTLANLATVKKKLGIIQEALQDFNALLKAFPQQADLHILHNNRANLYVQLQDYKSALEAINSGLKIKPDYDLGLLTRASIYLKMEQQTKACEDYTKALQLGVATHKYFSWDEDTLALKKRCGG
jgi:tetratricopeptide (TPR) repeat protein